MADLKELNEALFVLTDRIVTLVMSNEEQAVVDHRLIGYLDLVEQAHEASEMIHIDIDDADDPIWKIDE